MEKNTTVKKRRGWFRYPVSDKVLIFDLLSVKGRDGLLIKIGLFWGLRVSETSTIKWCDLITDELKVKKVVRIINSKQSSLSGKIIYREIGVIPKLREAIGSYYTYLRKPPLDHWVFKPTRNDVGNPMTPKSINRALKKWAVKLGEDDREFSYHTLRKTMITAIYEKYGQASAMDMSGHQTVKSFLVYLGIDKRNRVDRYVNFYENAEKSLPQLIANGELDIDTEHLLSGVSYFQWADKIYAHLERYTDNVSQLNESVRMLIYAHNNSNVDA